jgi:glutamate synthase (ferredoxin)
MRFVAQELREIMSKLGVRSVDELVGRTDLLVEREKRITHRAETVDLSALLSMPCPRPVPHFKAESVYDFHLERTKDQSVLLRELGAKLRAKKPGSVSVEVSSTDRAFGTLFGSEITRRYGSSLKDDTYTVRCQGGGGQSFGAFIPKGLTLRLEGDSNDGFGKGLSGGKLILYPPKGSTLPAEENIIVGNVALYGATSGTAFISGVAGERFCVRNSGASARRRHSAFSRTCGDAGRNRS